ncbi:MAG: hypothetical protein ACE37F_02135 [Nannocystaceae bacterium]|nr:hypothetical protein [bacterium]
MARRFVTLRQTSMLLLIASVATCFASPVAEEAGVDPQRFVAIALGLFLIGGLLYVLTGSLSRKG